MNSDPTGGNDQVGKCALWWLQIHQRPSDHHQTTVSPSSLRLEQTTGWRSLVLQKEPETEKQSLCSNVQEVFQFLHHVYRFKSVGHISLRPASHQKFVDDRCFMDNNNNNNNNFNNNDGGVSLVLRNFTGLIYLWFFLGSPLNVTAVTAVYLMLMMYSGAQFMPHLCRIHIPDSWLMCTRFWTPVCVRFMFKSCLILFSELLLLQEQPGPKLCNKIFNVLLIQFQIKTLFCFSGLNVTEVSSSDLLTLDEWC